MARSGELGLLCGIMTIVQIVRSKEVTIDTPQGPVIGHQDEATGFSTFLGIPFAEPPIGDRRWRKPTPRAPWSEPWPALTFRSDCAQRPNGFAPSSSEDCLYLQVWTPQVGAAQGLPVQVWHYGGSFLNGSTSYPMYNGAKMAKDNNGKSRCYAQPRLDFM